MKEFEELLEVAVILNGPNGCPWDVKQTFESLKPYILEEAHEVVDAVDTNNDDDIIEELGDLFYTVIFYSKVAEKQGRFSIKEILERVKDKLIRRHPHVFGEEKAESIEDVYRHWTNAKKKENKDKGRKSSIDTVPKAMPALLRAQKILKQIQKSECPTFDHKQETETDKLAHQLLQIVAAANSSDIDLESSLRSLLNKEEDHFRIWESENS